MDWEGQSKGYAITSSSLPYFRYSGGIFLLVEIHVSNSPIDWQGMWVKDFIHIELAYKCAQNYM